MNKTVFLITVDCLRKDAINKTDMPFLHSLSNKDIFFENYYANAPFTPASFPSIFCSKYPLDFKHYIPLTEKDTYLPRLLKKNNIFTIGLSSNVYISKKFGYSEGFDIFYDYLSDNPNKIQSFKNKLTKVIKEGSIIYSLLSKILLLKRIILPKYNTPYPLGKKVLGDAYNKVIQNTQDKFCFIHLMDVHNPYFPPKKYLEKYNIKLSMRKIVLLNSLIIQNPKKLTKEDLVNLKLLYRAGTRYTDDLLKEFYTRILRKNPNAIFFITADHGEEFGEHGDLKHKSKLYNELINIPLIVTGIKLKEKERLVSSVDILPTIMDIFKIDYAKLDIRGKSLLQKEENDYLIAESKHTKNRMPLINENELIINKNNKFYNVIATFNKKYKVIYDELEDKYEFYSIISGIEQKTSEENIGKLKLMLDNRKEEIKNSMKRPDFINRLKI